MTAQRLELVGLDRVRYFVPTAISLYLAVLCLVLIVTSAFLTNIQSAVAISAAGVFGLILTGGMGALFWHTQRQDLLYVRIPTQASAEANFATVVRVAEAAGWRIVRSNPPDRLEAEANDSMLDAAERIVVDCRGTVVLVASICSPGVGFSLTGRRRCSEHRAMVHRAVVRQGVSDATLGDTRQSQTSWRQP
jgi:hypothetical protein